MILVTSTNVINIKVSFAKKNSERNKKMNQFTKKLAVPLENFQSKKMLCEIFHKGNILGSF